MKKVFKAIGGFFVKIGRWIANTAWIQPLLIVGGIFAIIFSIPHIKNAIDSAVANNQTDEVVEYFKGKAISLDGAKNEESDLDKLFHALDTGEGKEEMVAKYGEKFFLSFVEENCSYCKECYNGFQYFENNYNDVLSETYKQLEVEKEVSGSFKLHTVMVDTLSEDEEDEGTALVSYVFKNHATLFEKIIGDFTESGNYALLNNLSSSDSSSLNSSIENLANVLKVTDGKIETPTTFLVDFTAESAQQGVNVGGITAVFFNYVDYVDGSTTGFDKSVILAECWSYLDIFSADYQGK